MSTISISDGEESVDYIDITVDAAIDRYVLGYGFNDPGDVECEVYDDEDCAVRKFLIRSTDGHRGVLVETSSPDEYGNWFVDEGASDSQGDGKMKTAQQHVYDLMLEGLHPTDKALHLAADIEGRQVQWDKSGVGHHWVLADADSMPPDIREEIACEIIDGKVDECGDYLAKNGQHYRWC